MADGKGEPKAKVHPVFKENAEQLRTDAENVEQALLNQAQRKWQILPLREWTGDPLAVPEISGKFKRDEIHENYTECLADPENPGTAADTQALTLQNDWVSMQERAFRARHATSVRSALHAAGRRKGHSSDKGVIQAGLVKYIQDVIKRGS